MQSRMANFTNYQGGKPVMLVLETQQRNAANVDGSAGEPHSPLMNISGGSRSHQLPPSYHHHHFEPQYHYELASHLHLHPNLSADVAEESPGRKSSSPPAASASQVYAAVGSSNSPDAADDIRKCGYLRKQKHGHKRFFVLRASSHLGPSRLEYYDSEKKFRSSLRGGTVGPSSPKRVIYLYQCFTVNKRADSKNKHLIALYTKDEYFAIVAENEQDQEDWYVAVSELMSEGRKGHLIADDLDDGYGTVTPGTVFKEVWNVNVKPKGLGQTKNLTGLFRLCLSSKTLHLVKLNSDTPCFNQHLMNIRRCGHSESFFFIEVGRFSSTGPGELWMQVDDSVVAQKMHETILDTMKALKAFAELRPRSKSQSSGSNPVSFITTRRHLSNLPPSQTGLQRRSRMESLVGTPPSSKSSGSSGYRFRTSSEGEGTMNRPFRSITGSLLHLSSARPHHIRAEGGPTSSSGAPTGSAGGGRNVRAAPGPSSSTHNSRSASLPMSHFPSTTSPVSVSSSSGHGSVSDTLTRPSSASICGSPSDGGFNSSDEYGSSPGDFRYFRVRSNTPDSLGNTPPIREENCLSDYMAVGWNREVFGTSAGSWSSSGAETTRDESTSTTEDERVTSSSQRRRRSGGPGVLVNPKITQTHFSLEEGADATFGTGLRRGGPTSSSSSLRSDYSSCSEHSQQSRPSAPSQAESGGEQPSAKEDSGYVPMMCGVATSPRDTPSDYMPMQPSFQVSHTHVYHSPAVAPRSAQRQSQSSTDTHGYMMMLPGCGGSSPSPVQATHGGASASGFDARPDNGQYMDMSSSTGGNRKPESAVGYYPNTPAWRSFSPYFSLPRSYKAPSRERDEKEYDDYVPMNSPAKPVHHSVPAPERRGGSSANIPPHPPPPYGAHHTVADSRVSRPNRLPLGRRSFHGPLRVGEPAASAPAASTSSDRPPSPGEYINIDFGDHYPRQQQAPPYALSTQDEETSSRDYRQTPPLPQTSQDYMSMETGRDHQESNERLGKSVSPRPSLVAPWNPPSYIRPLATNPSALASPAGSHWGSAGDDYTVMTFSKGDRIRTSPTAMLQHLSVMEDRYSHDAVSPTLPPRLPERPPEPKVIRADPQGRRRHSSETFSSTSSPGSTPSTNHPTLVTSNSSHLPDGQASRCAASASFDSVWMSVKSHGDPPVDEFYAAGTATVPSTSSGRMYANDMSAEYQNGLNYIALEPKESADVGESAAVPESEAYASLDCPKPDAVSSTTKD
ncbi:insulin receptor substrate 2-A isoform X1 [Corythoichthys intestinalis]|uniref:insulin receptor substrate 2-A isoform X1 n=1 Tax=Corythoichthys intestinalis TaxID=161448 RepID=UPI0025A52210|nr:insulin receptor substrate 2-A isoform X1 [Corythoichthys intestinalis]